MTMYLGALSLGAAASIINSISTLTLNVYSLSANIKLSKNIYHDDVKDTLIKTDLEANIKLLQSVIMDIPQYFNDNMSTIIALKNMQENIAEIESELKNIYDKMNYNDGIYLLKNIRSYDFNKEIKKLETHIQIMEKRKDNLFKTLELFKNCVKNNNPNEKLLMVAQIEKSIYNLEENITVM